MQDFAFFGELSPQFRKSYVFIFEKKLKIFLLSKPSAPLEHWSRQEENLLQRLNYKP